MSERMIEHARPPNKRDVLCQFDPVPILGWRPPGCRWLAYEWHLGSSSEAFLTSGPLRSLKTLDWWIEMNWNADSKIRRQLRISTGFQDLCCQAKRFFPFLEAFGHDLSPFCRDLASAANTGALLIAYPVHRQSHGRVEMLCLCLSAEDRWTDWESGNKTHLNHSQHVMAS